MKLKAFSGVKKCPSGEVYVFKDGVAKVPRFYIKNREVKITISEFKELTKCSTN
jgi:hypothetical protein